MKIYKLAVLSLFCLSACTAETPTPLPTIEPLRIAITPALAPLGVALQACASVQADTALLVDTIPANKIDLTDIDLAFRLEESQALPDFVAPIAWESLQVVFHPGFGKRAARRE